MSPENKLLLKKQSIQKFFTDPGRMSQLKEVLPNVGITAERMVRLVFSAFAQEPKLVQCSETSIYNAMIQCASIGLEPNTPLKQCYLIPYGDTATLLIDYRGYITVAKRSDEFKMVRADVVREGDRFSYSKGTPPNFFLEHKPDLEAYGNRIICAYAVVILKDGSFDFDVMSYKELMEHKARSKSSKSGPWVTDEAMQCRKTVIHRIMRYHTSDPNMAKAIQYDGQNEAGIQDMSGIIDIEATETENRNGHKESSLEAMAEAEEKNAPEPTKPEMVAEIQAKVGEMFSYDEVKMNGYLGSITPVGTQKYTVAKLSDMTEAQARSALGMVLAAHNEWLKKQK